MGDGDWQRVAAALRDQVVGPKSELRWTNPVLADKADVSLGTVAGLLAGKRSNYKPQTLAAVEKAVGWPEGTIRKIAGGMDAPDVSPLRDEKLAELEAAVRDLVDGQAQILTMLRRLEAYLPDGREPT